MQKNRLGNFPTRFIIEPTLVTPLNTKKPCTRIHSFMFLTQDLFTYYPLLKLISCKIINPKV